MKLPNGRALTGQSHDYTRHGTTTLFAALEMATGKVMASHAKRRRRAEFLVFMNSVVAAYPRRRLHVVLDNLNTHKKNERWLAKHPNVRFHFTPTQASWLNQVEIWFSILQDQSLSGASFIAVKQLHKHIDAFIRAYNQNAQPFAWTTKKVRQHRFKGRRITQLWFRVLGPGFSIPSGTWRSCDPQMAAPGAARIQSAPIATPSDYLRAGNEPTPEPKPKRTMSEQTRQRMARAHLSRRQARFIEEYVSTGNASEAVRRAGYSTSSSDVVRQMATQNLAKPHIASAIKARTDAISFKVTPDRVQRRIDEISHEAQSAGQFGPAVRAEELLGKSIGLFIDRSLQLTGQLNDSHVTALIEIAKRRRQEPSDLADDDPGHDQGPGGSDSE